MTQMLKFKKMMNKLILSIILFFTINIFGFSTAFAFDLNDPDAPKPTRILFQGESSETFFGTYWKSTRSVWYQNGEQELSSARNQFTGGTGGPSQAQSYTQKPGDATTQVIRFTIKLTHVTDRTLPMLDHAFVMGRLATKLPDLQDYDARGLAMWTFGNTNHFSNMLNERFLSGPSYAEPVNFSQNDNHVDFNNKLFPALSDDTPYRIMMQVNEYASAAWIYDLNGNFLDFKSWYTPGLLSSGGHGVRFGFYCLNGAEFDQFCNYQNPYSYYNQPYSVEFSDIDISWL